MQYHDISVPIDTDMPVYEGDPPVTITLFSSIKDGGLANVSRLHMGAHTGTHVDAPLHFFENGKAVHEIPLSVLAGPALVIELQNRKDINRNDLKAHNLEKEERVLLKTSNSSLWNDKEFRKDFVYLTQEAAEYLAQAGVKLVGIDYLSIEQFGAIEPMTHRILLGADIVIIEGLNLAGIRPGHYELICLPLPIKGCDGSPCRAILIEK